MSIIALRVNKRMELVTLVKEISTHINDQFEPLNFQQVKSKKGKIGYIRLSKKLDPKQVIDKLNSKYAHLGGKKNKKKIKGFKIVAYMPEKVPDIPLLAFTRFPLELRQKYNFPVNLSIEESIITLYIKRVLKEILVEMQLKYPGFHPINKKYLFRPVEELTKVVMERLLKVTDKENEATLSYYRVAQKYRSSHPHTGDFQLLVDVIHKIQEAAGEAKTEFDEKKMSTVPPKIFMAGNMPADKLQHVVNKYSARITKVMSDHIRDLYSTPNPRDDEETSARKRVREELQKMSPFLGQFVNDVVMKNFVPHRLPNQKMRIYGTPYLPSREVMQPWLKRYSAMRVMRSPFMFNMLRFSIPREKYAAIMTMDGTVISGAKLTIRMSSLTSCYINDQGNVVEEGEDLEEEEEDDDDDDDEEAEE